MSGPSMVRVKKDEDGVRLDRWFKEHYPSLGYGALQRLLRKGQVRVDGGRVQASRRLEAGETVRVPPMQDGSPPAKRPSVSRAEAQRRLGDMTVYEDDDLIALNKPSGLAVQGGAKTTEHLDALLQAVATGDEKLRLVHRLDRDTGGLLLIAKTRKSAGWLTESFRERSTFKEYWGLVNGVPQPLSGRIDQKIEKSGPQGQQKARPSDTGQIAISDYMVMETAAQKASFVAMRPVTGRTHQLRAHMALIGTPIVGDGKYGGAEAKLPGLEPRLHLFCKRMVLPRPGRKPIALEAPLGGPMLKTWNLFAFDTDAVPEWPEDIL